MSGVLLRHGGGQPHECDTPERGVLGDVWMCLECDRRWTCVLASMEPDPPEFYDEPPGSEPFPVDPARWKRRYWPWPRPPRELTPISGECVDRIEMVGGPTRGGPKD